MTPFTHTIRVRWNECDPQGIVFNANYVTYLDITVGEWWRDAFGSYGGFVAETGVDIVVGDLSLRFRAAARFDDEIAVTIRPALTSASSITSAFTMERGDDLLIEGSIRHVCVDAHALTKVPAPPPLIDLLGAPA